MAKATKPLTVEEAVVAARALSLTMSIYAHALETARGAPEDMMPAAVRDDMVARIARAARAYRDEPEGLIQRRVWIMSTLDKLVRNGYPPDAESALRFWFGGIFGDRTLEVMAPVLRAWVVTKPGANDGGKRALLAAALATIGDTVTGARLKKTRSAAKKKQKIR